MTVFNNECLVDRLIYVEAINGWYYVAHFRDGTCAGVLK